MLHKLKWKYLESIEIDDDSYLVPLESSKSSLVKFEKGKGWTAFSSSEFDDEKLTNYSNIWKLEIHWGVPIKHYNLHQTTTQNVEFSQNISKKVQDEFQIKLIEEGMDYLTNNG